MAEQFYPTTTSPVSTGLQWSRMARLWMVDGVDDLPTGSGLRPSVGSGTGNVVSVSAGRGWCRGVFYATDTAVTTTLPDNTTSSPRLDRIVLRVDLANNRAFITSVTGTPAASPTLPALTNDDTNGVYDLPLGYARVEASNISFSVTDSRAFVGRPVVYATSQNRPDPRGRPLVAYETDTRRVISHSGISGSSWQIGLGEDILRSSGAYNADLGNNTQTGWNQTLTNTTPATLSVTFTAPPSGRVLVSISSFLSNNSAGAATYLGCRIVDSAGTIVLPDDSLVCRVVSATAKVISGEPDIYTGSQTANHRLVAGLAAATVHTATLRYRVTAGTGSYDDQSLIIQPQP